MYIISRKVSYLLQESPKLNIIFFCHAVSGLASPRTTTTRSRKEELTPIDLDDEELEAYAEECARGAALADFDDIPEEELFSWSDFEEPDEHGYDMDVA